MSKIPLICLTIIIISLSLVATNATKYFTSQQQQQEHKVFAQTAAASSTTNNTNLTLGNPQIVYTEYGNTTNMIPFVDNETHGFRLSFIGNGTIQGINVKDNGRAISVSRADSSILSRGVGILTAVANSSGSSSSSTRGISAFTFLGTGHYGTDGKLRDFGPIYFLNATGNLAFLKDTAGVYKDQIDKAGNAITKLWLWKEEKE